MVWTNIFSFLVSRWSTLHDCQAQLRTDGKRRGRRDYNQCSLRRSRPRKRAIYRKKDTFVKVILFLSITLHTKFMSYGCTVGLTESNSFDFIILPANIPMILYRNLTVIHFVISIVVIINWKTSKKHFFKVLLRNR